MKTKLHLIALLAIAAAAAVFAQGPLTPPAGTPAPTMKTLDQVEPRKPVDATNTPGDADSVFRISARGSYYLTGNVTGVAGKAGIEIAVDNVTVDLSGFTMQGVAGSLAGIRNGAEVDRITVRNGVITGFGEGGIDLRFFGGGISSVIEHLHVSNNGGRGIFCSFESIVRGCIVTNNTTEGIFAGTNSIISECISNSNGSNGILVDWGSIVRNCSAIVNGGAGMFVNGYGEISNCAAHGNSGDGIETGSGVTLTSCTASTNTGDGIHASSGSSLINCTAADNEGIYGIFAGEGSTLTNCSAFSNDVEEGIHADLRSTLTNCTASLNTSAATDSWGISAGAQCTISGCTSSGNTNTNATPGGSTGGGILAASSCTIQNCTVAGNKGDGIQIGADARVVGNNCDSNGFGGGNAAGIHSTGADNRIETNNVTDNTRGIDVDSSGTLIIKNSAAGNTSVNYEIAANNVYGPIVDRTAPASVAVSGNSAASSAGTTDPWANFSY